MKNIDEILIDFTNDANIVLDYLEKDIEKNPDKLLLITKNLTYLLEDLMRNVEVNIDEALDPKDE